MAIILLHALNNGKMLHKTETPILKFALWYYIVDMPFNVFSTYVASSVKVSLP